MKLYKKAALLTAAAAAATLGSAGAFALGPTATVNLVFYAGGGSAEPQAVAVSTCNLMNNVDVYTSSATNGADSKYLVLFGSTKAAHGSVPQGTNVMVMYKFNGGSFPNGGVPQSSASVGLPYPSSSTVLTGATLISGQTAGSFCTAGNGNPTYFQTNLQSTSGNQQPSFGLTDVEPTAFVGFNNPLAPAALPAVGAAAGIYDLVFGLAETPQLWAQKQNFSYSEVAGILSGVITNWNQLYGDQGAFKNAALPAGNIILLDRNVGSGHKTSSSAEFLGYPQLGAAATFPHSATKGYKGGQQVATSCTGIASACGLTVSQAGQCSGGTCTIKASGGALPVDCSGSEYQDIQETSAATSVTDLKSLSQTSCNGGERAVAILSMDNPPGFAANQVGGANAYYFVSLNNSFVDTATSNDNENGTTTTSYVNALTGNYTWFYQASFNTISGGFLTSGTEASDLASAYLGQLQSTTLPGCSASPGQKFPLNLVGVVNDLDVITAPGTLGACMTVTSRDQNSDQPLFPFQTLSGPIVLGADPVQ